MPKLLDPGYQHAKSLRKSRKQEKAVAGSDGKVTPGSGNQWHSKGDVKLPKYLVECKYTDKESYSLKKQDLDKHQLYALREHREPVFEVSFGGNRWVIIPADLWDKLNDGNSECSGSDINSRRLDKEVIDDYTPKM